jgi:hypothetical protein
MPLQKLQFRPGLNREGTDYANEGGWYDGDKIRFRSGFPEKIGGWTRLSNNQYIGTARSMWNWIDLDGTNYLGVGTNEKYYIERGGEYNDVTPIYHTSTTLGAPSGPFTATTGSATLTVVDAGYTPNVGDWVTFTGAVSLGGNITAAVLNQEYEILSVDSLTTSYTIAAKSSTTGLPVLANASDTGHGGGAITAYYQVPIGLDVFVVGTGWGAGPWGGVAAPAVAALGANPFATTATSGVVTVTQTAHGLSSGTYVVFSGATAVGGVAASMLNSTYTISNITANTYDITLPSGSVATSTTTGGGSAVTVTIGSGTRGWGTAFTGGGIGQQLRLWSNDNYGQDLVIAPRGGAIYYWKDSTGVAVRAQSLSALSTAEGFSGAFVPHTTNAISASSIQRFLIAMGANPYDPTDSATEFDPMLVRWSDQENPYEWVPEVTNQSGEFRLSNGSFIVTYKNTRQEILVWTDACLYSMQYLGPPYVWGFNILMDNISIISPNAAVTINNVTYWMGADKFYMYSGRVETLPCSLRQYIFNNINKDQAYQIFAGSNEGYNEVWWFYVSAESTDNTVDKYVIYNYLDRVWYYGSMARTAWLDSGIRPYPMAANYENRILYHESAVDDVSGLTPVAINAYVQSSDFDIGDGHNFGFVWRILPDVNFNGSNVNQPYVTMTIKPRQNSGTPYGSSDNPEVQSQDNYSRAGVYNIQQFDGQVYTRLRGRQLAFRIESDSLGVSWQLGTPRIDIRNDGRR